MYAQLVETGLKKVQGADDMSAEELAFQARIDAGIQKVIGVNTYRLPVEEQLDVLRVDNDDVYRQQVAKLERLRAERDQGDVDAALAALTRSAEAGDGNLLELAVAAARHKATVGEISAAPISLRVATSSGGMTPPMTTMMSARPSASRLSRSAGRRVR